MTEDHEIRVTPPPSNRASSPRPKRRWRWIALSVVGLVAVVLVRLTVASLDLPLTGFAGDALTRALGTPIHVDAVGVRLERSGAALTIDGVRLRTDSYSASIARISVLQGLSGRAIRLEGAAIRLDPSKGDAGDVVVPHPDAAILALDRALDTLVEQAAQQGFESLTVAGGRLDLVSAGRPIDEARVYLDVNAHVALADRSALRAEFRATGASGPITASLSRVLEADGRATIALEADGASPLDMAHVGPVRSGFRLSPRVLAHISADCRVLDASLSLNVGPGTVVFGKDPMRAVDAISLDLSRSDDGRTLRVDQVALTAGNTKVVGVGTIVPSEAPDTPWRFAAETVEARLDAPDIVGPPVVPTRVEVSGTVDFAARLINVETFDLALPTGKIDAVFTFDFSERGPNLSGAATIGPSTVEELIGLWPPVMAHEPRVAMLTTVMGGMVRGGEMTFALTPLELDGNPETNDMIEGGLAVDINFANATFVTPELPIAVQRASGLLRLRDKALSVRLGGGVVETGDGGGQLRVRSGAFSIPKLGASPVQAVLTANVDGPLSAVVALANTLDVPELKKTPLTPDDVAGRLEAAVSLRTPLGPDVPDSAREWSIDARLFNAAAKVPIAGQTFSDANVEVLINRRRLAARGRARIDGLTVDVNYSEIFDGAKSGGARFVLTDKDRKARGFDTGEMVRGPVVVTLEAVQDEARVVTADLTEAEISLPFYLKPEGAALTGTAEIFGEPADLAITNMRFAGKDGVKVSGDLALKAGELAQATFSAMSLSQGDDVTLSVTREGKAYRATIEASRFDAGPMVRSLKERRSAPAKGQAKTKGAGLGVPLILEARAAHVQLNDTSKLADVAVSANYDGQMLTRLSARGKLNDVNAGNFVVELKPGQNGTRRLQADVTELGRLLAALDLYPRMRGGRTTLDARLDADGVMAGRLRTGGFVLAGEETLEDIVRRTAQRKLSQGAADTGQLGATAGTAIDGMSFDRLAVDFTKRGDSILISEAILRGPILGGTAEGAIDLNSGTMLLNGTLIPAYGLNNLFGRLPVFGKILGGGDTGGLIGVTFRLAGPIDNPQLIVNPMSAIAPGIFRRIFEFR